MSKWLGLALICILVSPSVARGEMSSTNYSIYADSVGFNGGTYGSSDSFVLSDSIGETPLSGVVTSTSYELRGGYQAMERGSLQINVSPNTINLGQLSATEVKTATTSVAVNTENTSGYTLAFTNVGPTPLTKVADGTVTAGVEEFGVGITGVDRSFEDDRAIESGLVLASSASTTYNSMTIITFKASISPSTAAGSKRQTVTITASANF